MTLLEEFQAEQRANLTAEATKPGAAGAYARLCLRADPHEMGRWLTDEVKAGTSAGDIIEAAAAYRSLSAMTFCSAFGDIVEALNALNYSTAFATEAVLRGYVKGRGIAIKDDGTQHEVTTDGIFGGKSKL